MVGCHVSGFAVAPQEVEAQRPAQVKFEDLQNLDLHGSDLPGGARVVGDVDEVTWKKSKRNSWSDNSSAQE